jgi:hypothetical protein
VNLVCKLSPFNLPGSGYLVKNALKPVVAEDGEEFYFVDGIVGRQGPNYALAKRIQHWRAIVARETDKVGALLSCLVLWGRGGRNGGKRGGERASMLVGCWGERGG